MQHEVLPDVSLGSTTSFWPRSGDVRCTPGSCRGSGHRLRAKVPLTTKRVSMHRSKRPAIRSPHRRGTRSHQHGNNSCLENKPVQQLQSLRPRRLFKKTTPVTLPPGRLKLTTYPDWTGLPPPANTTGTLVVAALAAGIAVVFVTIAATGWRSKLATSAGNRFYLIVR
jgi:hypothetical protein